MPKESIPFGEACRIAGIKPGTARMWRKRARDRASEGVDQAILRSEFFEPKGGQVDREGLQFLCIFAQLSTMGLPIRDAAECAWAYTGVDQTVPPRDAGRPFKSGRTVLAVARPDFGKGFTPKVLNLAGNGQDERPSDVFLKIVAEFKPPSTTVLLVDINAIEVRVDDAFVDPDEQGAVA